MRFFILLLTLFCFNTSFAASLSTQTKAFPGGIKVIALEDAYNTRPKVTYNNKPVLLMLNEESGQWQAIVGIPLKEKIGKHFVRINNNKKIHFQVSDKKYPEERLVIKNKKMVNPAKPDLERIQKEYKKLRLALSSYSDDLNFETLSLKLPTKGRFSSPFGLKRYYNDQPRNPHSGLDIAAPTGQIVHAAMDGKVLVTGHFYFNGNTVVIDHGQGMKTLYCHLSEISVKTGDFIKQSSPIGKVGMTGRVTGPHLHWTLVLNDAKVNPELLL